MLYLCMGDGKAPCNIHINMIASTGTLGASDILFCDLRYLVIL